VRDCLSPCGFDVRQGFICRGPESGQTAHVCVYIVDALLAGERTVVVAGDVRYGPAIQKRFKAALGVSDPTLKKTAVIVADEELDGGGGLAVVVPECFQSLAADAKLCQLRLDI